MPDIHQPGFTKLTAIIDAIGIGMLTTENDSGNLRSRPIETQRTEGSALWFFTAGDTPKVEEIEKAPRVNISYADPNSHTYVSVSGKAQTVRDSAKIHELWNANAAHWFPKGPDDARVTLIRVEMTQAEYWDVDTQTMQRLLDEGARAEKLEEATDHQKIA